MKHTLPFLVAAVLITGSAYAQSGPGGIDIFGYMQAYASSSLNVDQPVSTKTFRLGQVNLFFNKNFNDEISSLVNLQFVNSFSTVLGTGSMSIEEAWVRYRLNNAFNIKGGLLIPTFNNLNEIKNKTPLLPYVLRPLVYESTIASLIRLEDYLPERAYVQVYGFVPLNEMKLDYAVYAGNSESSFLTRDVTGTSVSGSDTSKFKLVGGRVGVRAGNLKVGLSSTFDKENHSDPAWGLPAPAPAFPTMGPVSRTRIGGDLSYSIAGFTLESEFIFVKNSLSDKQQTLLNTIATMTTNPLTGLSPFGKNLNKSFYYGNLMYNFTDQWYGYAGYSYMNDNLHTYSADGLTILTFGGGFAPIEQAVFKAQYAKVKLKNTDFMKLDLNTYYLAINVFF